MTKLTLGKSLSPEAQAKLDKLTASSTTTQSQAQRPQDRQHQKDQRIKAKLQNLSKHTGQSSQSKQNGNQTQKPAQGQKAKAPQNTKGTKPAADKPPKVDPRVNETMQRRLSHQAFIAACDYLIDTYPDAFNLEDPKPLKLHIDKDIYPNLPEGISRLKIRQALSAYARHTQYLESFTKYTQRVDLTGAFAGDVTDSQREHAAVSLKQMLQSQEKKRQEEEERKAAYLARIQQTPKPSTDIDAPTDTNTPTVELAASAQAATTSTDVASQVGEENPVTVDMIGEDKQRIMKAEASQHNEQNKA